MKNKISGQSTLYLARTDASGNHGYSLTFSYRYDEGELSETIEFSDILFSGPGTWEDFGEGDDYPYGDMARVVRDDTEARK
jgi:hypothetical protein